MSGQQMEYEREGGDRYEEEPRYEGGRDRSRSPRPTKDESYDRQRSASPNGRVASRDNQERSEEPQAHNPGSNLFVTGIHPSLNEEDVTRMFEKYGQVENCSIMKDPHSQESRGFGFVKMTTSDQADAARDGLQGENCQGRTLSIEKARRNRPRTPTPGRYFGPPKRDDPRGGGGRRFDDRGRGGGYGGGDRYGRDDYYRSRDNDRYDDRRGGGGGYGGGRRDDFRGGDRYRRDDYDRRDDRRGGGRSYGGGGDEYRSGGGSGRDATYERPARERSERTGGGYSGGAAGEDSYSRR